ncbi:MAG: hypothetical protein N2170_06330 [Bacteroidia bacterium]|nr:hypothetical protein [Bacteroidia bacterium]
MADRLVMGVSFTLTAVGIGLSLVFSEAPKSSSTWFFLAIPILLGGVGLYQLIAYGAWRKRRAAATQVAWASVLSIHQTGTRVNKNHKVILEVEVQPDEGSPFRSRLAALLDIPQISLLSQPQAQVKVRYNPQDTQEVFLA